MEKSANYTKDKRLINIDRLTKQYNNFTANHAIVFQKDNKNVSYDKKDLLTKEEFDDIKEKLNVIMDKTLTNVIPDLLFYFFFSKDNVDSLQRNIRYLVNKYSGFNIGNQSESDLLIIMESIFNQYGKHLDDLGTPKDVLFPHIHEQLKLLNKLVLQEAVPIIINGIEQKVGFLNTLENKDTSKLDRPVNTSVSGTKMFRSIEQIQQLN